MRPFKLVKLTEDSFYEEEYPRANRKDRIPDIIKSLRPFVS